jgi:hypothetical protein
MNDLLHAFKKCPECLANLKMDADRCHECKTKVGPVGRRGIAKRPVDWLGYLLAVTFSTAIAYFIWWAFLK